MPDDDPHPKTESTPSAAAAIPPPQPEEDGEWEDVGESPVSVLVSHADRCWKAEESNAGRLAARANLVLSGVTAIIGLKLFALGKEMETILSAPIGGKVTMFWVFCIVAALLLLVALTQVLGIRRWELTFDDPPHGHKDAPTASAQLRLPPLLLASPEDYSAEDTSWVVFSSTYDAFTDLQARNAKRKEAVDSAQRKLFWAILALAIGMGLYTAVAHEHGHREWTRDENQGSGRAAVDQLGPPVPNQGRQGLLP